MRVIHVIAVAIIGIMIWIVATGEPNTHFTRICAERGGSFQCNDYDGWRYPSESGCTAIEITGAKSKICGDYTIEHRTKKE